MNDDAQILIARLLTHQALTRKDKLVKRALSDELFRMEIDQRLAACGMKLLDNVYADHVTLALTRDVEPKVFGEREVWTKQQHGAGPRWRGFAGGVVGTDHLPKRERQEAHQHAEQDQNDMFDKEKPLPSAEDASIGISYRALLADFGDKLGKKTRMDMNLGQLSRFGFHRTSQRHHPRRSAAGLADGYRHPERTRGQWRIAGYFSVGAASCGRA